MAIGGANIGQFIFNSHANTNDMSVVRVSFCKRERKQNQIHGDKKKMFYRLDLMMQTTPSRFSIFCYPKKIKKLIRHAAALL